MRWLPGVPVWILAIVAIVAAGVFLWRTYLLMANRSQRRAVLIALAIGLVFLGLSAGAKRSTASHAMVLFTDAMLAWVIGILPVSRQIKAANVHAAETGERLPIGPRNAKIGAYSITGVLALLLLVEYLIP